LGACLGIAVHIVGPAAFAATDRAFRRAGLDYLDHVSVVNHISFESFDEWRRREQRRLLLLTTQAEQAYFDFAFREDDVLLCGRESSGVPARVREVADARLRIPMQPDLRSLNVA